MRSWLHEAVPPLLPKTTCLEDADARKGGGGALPKRRVRWHRECLSRTVRLFLESSRGISSTRGAASRSVVEDSLYEGGNRSSVRQQSY